MQAANESVITLIWHQEDSLIVVAEIHRLVKNDIAQVEMISAGRTIPINCEQKNWYEIKEFAY